MGHTGHPMDFPVNLPVADNRLKMFIPTINTDNTLEVDQPLVICFSQPVDPAFVEVDITPDKSNWAAQWSPNFDQVTLVPDVSPEPGQKIQLTSRVLGGPEIQKTIICRRLPPQQQLSYDLQNNRIDINQASCYRIFSLFDPSKDGYETTPISRNDSSEDAFQLTFSSGSKAKKGLPMDPVWQAKESTELWATGEGRIERPIDRQISESGKHSSTKGMATETFEWTINLSRENQA